MRAQQQWHKLDREVAALKAEHAAEIHRLKQESSAWQGKLQEESQKAGATAEQMQRQEEKAQAIAADKEKALGDLQDAVKVH